ncbi:dihydroxy-acid dehydratase (plasmid) [Microvirga ossetica]|uniref:Dihydroxy-acid dehydratase n=1 Tax=Microvirga ossetica TaxID=1882682 RepID=A0A1B2EVR8_9HYPH|nr:L-arabinonate dehydratase [Microvirga ossetica]ANY84044.1 dihydroxy-acid dehydratase [Microvirga ossetica]
MKRIEVSDLRSQRWFDAPGIRSFNVRTRALQMGYSRRDFEKKPVIAILNTWSDFAQCHSHFKQRVEEVKRGVLQAGGLPMELPAMSLSETMVKPTTMLYRNFLAMEAEELIWSHPVDGVVLMGGCDKTTPGLIMGAASAGLPAIFVPAGPMLTGRYRGRPLGSGSDNWKFWDERRAGTISEHQWHDMEASLARSPGHCMTMGTASTMTSAAEALGLTLPGAASIPAVDSAHARMASDCGRRIVELVWEDVRPQSIATRASFLNAVAVVMALGGSTNAVIHLIAMAGRFGVPLTLRDFDEVSRVTPVLANLRPSGAHLMEDFYYAGGLRGIMSRMTDRLDLSCLTVSGLSLGETLMGAEVFDDDVIRPLDRPVASEGGIAILTGSLAPDGAVIKHSAASPNLSRHQGRAVVFEDRDDLARRIDDEALEVDETSVLVMKNGGAVGAPGLPEWGALPIPKKLLAKGVRDMVRISDARMSGTSFGTCILHVSPEAARGGPLALVQDGDLIELDIPARRIELCVDADELARRRDAWTPPAPFFSRGYGRLFAEHVTSADQGCDFDFLHAGTATPEPKIY